MNASAVAWSSFYGGLGISKLQFFIKKIQPFSVVIEFRFLIIKTLDLDPDPEPDPFDLKCWIWICIRIRIETDETLPIQYIDALNHRCMNRGWSFQSLQTKEFKREALRTFTVKVKLL